MQVRYDGTPVITTPQDQQKADRFIDLLVDRVYDRLPRFIKLFLSKEKLVSLLRGEIQQLANGL